MSSAPIYVVWEITLRCDLSCGHCGSRAGKPRETELSTEQALDVVRQLAEMGTREVTLIGGEAYLRPDWHVIGKAITDRGIECTMTTGGRGMTPERAALAKQAGLTGVSVSIDGMREAHDTQRGVRGSFDSALAALACLRAADVPVHVNTQLNRLSVPDLDRVLDVAASNGARGWQVQLTVPMGRAADRSEWLLEPYELLDLYPRLAELAVKGRARGVRLWPANNIGYYGPHESVIRNRGNDGGPLHWTGCPAGTRALGIESDGAIKGCPSLPTESYVGGHITERSLRDIWDTTRELRYTRDRTVDDLWGYCRSCYYAEECRAGCTWTSHVFFGRPGNNPYCHHRALDHASRGLRERVVRVQAAPGSPFDHGRFEIVVEPIETSVKAPAHRLPLL